MLSDDGSNVGGATISLSYLTDYLKKYEYEHYLLDTQFFKKKWTKILNPIRVLLIFLQKIRQTDVVIVSVSQFGAKTVAPILYILTKFFDKKFVFRPFGGAMLDHYEKYPHWQKNIFDKTLLNSDIFFLQTKQLVNYFAPRAKNVLHLSTSRYEPNPKNLRPERPFQKRFIFLGHVNESKGIDYLLEAVSHLDDSYTIDIFGPIHEEKYHNILKGKSNYKGVLNKAEVLPELSKYDVLILPTFYRGEGYPGAIVESYSLGLPVITTDWRAISEIVEEGKTGRVIPIKSSAAIVSAIQSFTVENYAEFSRQARAYFMENFEAEEVTREALEEVGKCCKKVL